MPRKKPETKPAPAPIHCAQCKAIAEAEAAHKAAGIAERAATRATAKALQAAEAARNARPRAMPLRRAVLWIAAGAAALSIYANIATAAAHETAADGAPVYHVAIIETADGRTISAAMASESACLAFTRAIAADVAAADCAAFTGAPITADYNPPKP